MHDKKRMAMGMATAMMALGIFSPMAAFGDVRQDAYLQGYVQAVLERQLGVASPQVHVQDGQVTITVAGLTPRQKERIDIALADRQDIKQLNVVLTTSSQNSPEQPVTPVPAAATSQATVSASNLSGPVAVDRQPSDASPISGQWFPDGASAGSGGKPFEPLMADPRWPHFGASLQHQSGERLKDVWSVSFGETLPFYREMLSGGAVWEAGLQPGLFALFDANGPSSDLQNADYFLAGYAAYRDGDFSAMLRLLHQSSHLGDEYILANPGVPRVNLSYESANLIASYDLTNWLRAYGGFGLLFDTDPSGLEPVTLQYGLEWRSAESWTLGSTRWRPVAAVDVKHWQETDWTASVSLRGGIELTDRTWMQSKLQILLEYYNGQSPDGQFYGESIRYYGVGLHFYY